LHLLSSPTVWQMLSFAGYVFCFGMGGWLDLTQQGLSPCKKYRASWRSSAKPYRIIALGYLFIFNKDLNPFFFLL